MSDFYSRCLVCGVDLPRGCSFCTEAHKLRWHAEHTEEARPVVMTDEWPLVERESEAKEAVPHNAGRRETMDGQEEGTARPTARSLTREERMANHDPRSCDHPHCRLAF